MRQTVSSARRFYRFLMEHVRGLFWSAIALSIVVTVTEGIGVLLLLPMLEAAGIETRTSSIESITTQVKQMLGWFEVRPTVPAVLALFLFAMILHEIVSRIRRVVIARLHARIAATMRSTLFAAVARTRWAFFSAERQAGVVKALTLDVERTVSATLSVHSAAVALFVVMLYLMLALYVSLYVTLMVASTGVLIYAMMARYLARSAAIGKGTGERIERLYSLTGEYLAAMKTVKSYDKVEDCIARFDDASGALSGANAEDGAHQAKMEMYYKIGAAVGLCLIVFTAVQMLALPTADLLFLLVLFARVMPKLASTTRDAFNFASHITSFDDIEDLTVRCGDNLDPDSSTVTPAKATRLTRDISLDNLWFAYDPARPVLTGVSLAIPAGSVVALAGASGAGKTTLLDLVMGLLTPDAGCIRIDDQPLTSERAHALRAGIGYVGQDTFLFNASVRDNLTWGAAGADEAEIRAALEMASAHFVDDLANGLETLVGDRGALLSGGQRQRLSLARALLRRPTMLILDEATSALDRANEEHIMASVRELRGAMTVLIVSHRASAVREADSVHVLDGGRIVASGTWVEVGAEVLRRTAV